MGSTFLSTINHLHFPTVIHIHLILLSYHILVVLTSHFEQMLISFCSFSRGWTIIIANCEYPYYWTFFNIDRKLAICRPFNKLIEWQRESCVGLLISTILYISRSSANNFIWERRSEQSHVTYPIIGVNLIRAWCARDFEQRDPHQECGRWNHGHVTSQINNSSLVRVTLIYIDLPRLPPPVMDHSL